MNAVETHALTKRFRKVEAVSDLDMRIEAGSIYALMGPNGAGKTTLIKMLMNLVSPTAGRAVILGIAASTLRGRQLESIGYVSENQKLPDWMTVGQFLRYWRPFYPSWDGALEEHLTERFALPLNRKLKNLSRGMRMKASLASALAFRPKLLVLDEPLSGLDPLVRDDLIEALLEQAVHSTVLISSHDLAEIDTFATHVGFMDDGRLRFSGPISEVRRRFRRVEVSADASLPVPSETPGKWLHFSIDGPRASWVETEWDESAGAQSAIDAFGNVSITSSPLTLREVFLTLAKKRGSSSNSEVAN